MSKLTNNIFSRRVLLVTTGMTPQVVTETLYSLVVQQKNIPTEIQLITTEFGKNLAIRALLDPQEGRFHTFCREYGLVGKIKFGASSIYVIEDEDHNSLSDIRNPQENACAANMILDRIRQLCQDDNCSLHVSIAGGRKTMGFFAGYALSLYARPQDVLSHVLVSEPFENNRDFYYPTQKPRTIYRSDGSPIDTQDAKVMLAEIPLVHLRGTLDSEALSSDSSYIEAVLQAQRAVREISLVLNPANFEIICSGIPIKTEPIQFAVYVWLAKRALNGNPYVSPGKQSEVREFLDVYAKLVSEYSGNYERAEKAYKDPTDFLQAFREKTAKTARNIRKELGKNAAKPYLVSSSGRRGKLVYGLRIDPKLISFKGNIEFI